MKNLPHAIQFSIYFLMVTVYVIIINTVIPTFKPTLEQVLLISFIAIWCIDKDRQKQNNKNKTN